MGKIVFALRGYGGRLFQAKNGIKEMIYWKKYLIEGSQHPLKPFSGSNQIWATTSDKKDTAQTPVALSVQSTRKVTKNPAKPEILVLKYANL